ncbi:phosphoheptose isomerase [Catellatospora citrea]|uniref:Phosphoheptose isomerase n=1 Tax=Catellatospora citrea TaxID=53366 RepID=A0A8J3KMP5_9ACTN|nr:phosphoheptose isomerase [Catellatospora citrea]RKE06402.1 D-sedoheptulose 7-phosphate isomerase [Catellatospora citrea]GIG02617.1 phosphoheptose isomerase [Catellatospora citrea]
MTAAAVLTTALAQRRERPGADLAESAPDLVAAAAAMARRFRWGGVLHAFGHDDADAHHIAVEFVHPVIVGKRALPAIAHGADRATYRLRHAAPGDLALAVCDAPARRDAEPSRGAPSAAVGSSGETARNRAAEGADSPKLGDHTRPGGAVAAALAAAGERGLLTVALAGRFWVGPPVDHLLTLPADDPLVLRELQVSAYHLLWELTHALLEHGPDGPTP